MNKHNFQSICGQEQKLQDVLEIICCQENCENVATRYVYWPGKFPPPKMCLHHAVQAIQVMDALGLDLVTEEIK